MAANRQTGTQRDVQDKLFRHKIFFGSSRQFEDAEARAELVKYGPILDYSRHWDKSCGYVTYADAALAQSIVGEQLLLQGGAVIEIRAYVPAEEKRESDAIAIKSLLAKHQRAMASSASSKKVPLASSHASVGSAPKVSAWSTGSINLQPTTNASSSLLNAESFPSLGNNPSVSALAPSKPKPQPIAAPSAPVAVVKAKAKPSASAAATVANPQQHSSASSSSLVGGTKVDVQIKEHDVPLQAAVNTRFSVTLMVANDTNTSKTLESVSVDGKDWKSIVSIPKPITGPTTIGPQQQFPVQILVSTPPEEGIITVGFTFRLKERSLKHKLRIFVVDLPVEEIVPQLPQYRPDSLVRRKIPYPEVFASITMMEHVPHFPNPEALYPLTSELRARLDVAKHEPLTTPVWKDRSAYKARMHDLLWMEEMEELRLLRQFDLPRTKMSKFTVPHFLDPLLSIEVSSLNERRPTLSVGDTLYAWVEGSKDVEYCGYIYSVKHAIVVASFAPEFHRQVWREDLYFTVRFSISRHQFLVEHTAVDDVDLDVVWPDASLPAVPAEQKIELAPNTLADAQISGNEKQMRAVSLGLNRREDGNNIPLLVFGPFGTGKTRTLVELIYQIFQKRPKSHILVCALSNSAADLLAERIANIPVVRNSNLGLLRLYAHTRSADQGDQSLSNFTWIDPATRKYGVPPHLRSYRVVVATCSNAASIRTDYKGHFSHIIIDEAAQVKESIALIPLSLADRNTSIVMAGDPKQLHYKSQSRDAALATLSLSIMERLLQLQTQMNKERPHLRAYIHLDENYRSHPVLMDFASKQFYNGELKSRLKPSDFPPLAQWNPLGNSEFPMVYAAVEGTEQCETDSPSFFNLMEAKCVVILVQSLLRDQGELIKPEEIGIISPFGKQINHIRFMLRKVGLPTITVASITGLQGKEFKALFISTVRTSRKHLESDVIQDIGFINNPNALNTVVTRAKALLVVVGDPYTIRLDPHWDAYVQACYAHGNLLGELLGPERIAKRAADDEVYMATGKSLVTALGQSTVPVEDLLLHDYDEPMDARPSHAENSSHYGQYAQPSSSQHQQQFPQQTLASLGNPTLVNGASQTYTPLKVQKNAPEYHPSHNAAIGPPRNAHSVAGSVADAGDRTLLIMDHVPFLLRIPGFEAPQAIVNISPPHVEVVASILGCIPRVTKDGPKTLTIEIVKVDGPSWSNAPAQQALQIVIPTWAVHYNLFATPTTLKILFYRSPNITPLVGSDDFAKFQLQ